MLQPTTRFTYSKSVARGTPGVTLTLQFTKRNLDVFNVTLCRRPYKLTGKFYDFKSFHRKHD